MIRASTALAVALAFTCIGRLAGTAAGQDPARSTPVLVRPGDIVAANIADHTVTVYDGESGVFRGTAVEARSGGLANPTGIAFGPDGALYVASSGSASILRFDAEAGSFRDVVASGEPLTQPFSLIFGPDGDLFVSDGPRVLRYAPDGSFVGVAAEDSTLVQPIGLAFGPSGLLYVANSTAQTVSRFDPATGRRVDDFATDSLSYPSDVAFGPDGDLYVSSAAGSRVVRFDGSSGAFRAVVATLPDGGVPMGLVFRAGRLVIGDFGKSRLFFLDALDGSAAPREVAREGLHGPENVAVRPGAG